MKKFVAMFLVILLTISIMPVITFAAPHSGLIDQTVKSHFLPGAYVSQYQMDDKFMPMYPIYAPNATWTGETVKATGTRVPWSTPYGADTSYPNGKMVKLRLGNNRFAGATEEHNVFVTYAMMQKAYAYIIGQGYYTSSRCESYGIPFNPPPAGNGQHSYYAANVVMQRISGMYTSGNDDDYLTLGDFGSGPSSNYSAEIANFVWDVEQEVKRMWIELDTYAPLAVTFSNMDSDGKTGLMKEGIGADAGYYVIDITIRVPASASAKINYYSVNTGYKELNYAGLSPQFSGNLVQMATSGGVKSTKAKVRIPISACKGNEVLSFSTEGFVREPFEAPLVYETSVSGQGTSYFVFGDMNGSNKELLKMDIKLKTKTWKFKIPAGKPDLTVTGVTSDKETYTAGDAVTISAITKNIGGQTTPRTAITSAESVDAAVLKPNGTMDFSQNVLAPNQTQNNFKFKFTTDPNIKTTRKVRVTITTDARNQIDEANEDNNVKSIIITIVPKDVTLPDLIISSLKSAKAEYRPGDTVNIAAVVKNQGNVACGKKTITGLVSGHEGNLTVDGGTYRGRYETGDLAIGGTETENFKFLVPSNVKTSRYVTLTFMADRDSELTESNENNNTKTVQFLIRVDSDPPPPKPTPTPPPDPGGGGGTDPDPEEPEEPPKLPDFTISINPGEYIAGTEVVLTAVVYNIGQASEPYVPVRLWFGNDVYYETIPVPTAYPESPNGGHYTGKNIAVFRVRVPNTPGTYLPIRAYVDPDEYILEENEWNNEDTGMAYITKLNDPTPVDALDKSLEDKYINDGKTITPLPPATPDVEHVWEEIRYEDEEYILKIFTARIHVELEIRPDQRISKTSTVESGFGIEQVAKTVISTNYDRSDKLVGSQFVYLTYPETQYNEGAREHMTGSPAALRSFWNYPNNSNSVLNMPLHYSPLWFPDRKYEVLCTAFYAWTPGGMATAKASHFVNIKGDMYDRFTTVNY